MGQGKGLTGAARKNRNALDLEGGVCKGHKHEVSGRRCCAHTVALYHCSTGWQSTSQLYTV
eukprot:62851-Chlamydomonas_euryale.AAC.2